MAVAALKTGTVRTPAKFDRSVSGQSITPVDLWRAVQLAAAGRTGVRCAGAAEVVVPSVEDCSEEDLQEFVNGLDRCVSITADGGTYRIAHGYDVDAADDDAGVTTAVTELRRDGRPVILSLSRVHYAAGNDDYDAITAREEALYLIDDADPLGTVVFALLASATK